ncbi:hypothetical protein C9890_0430 [Perkinsus sp. BL_2016]|nr:hypothetical protein C9890_0430 [Perkinsus sp. BL_2016]
MSTSAQSTLNRSSKNRLGLLLKQYYDDPGLSLGSGASGTDLADEYSLSRLEKLKTDSLMAKAVESLRSYKEAESDLRMLLYNNCDKLLKGVHVVSDIRQGSRDVDAWGRQLDQEAGKIRISSASARIERYNDLRRNQLLVEQYLKLRQDIFIPLCDRFPLVGKVYEASRTTVEQDLVPLLMIDGKSRVAILMDLFPRGHEKHGEVMQQFVELEIAKFDDKLCSFHVWSFEEAVGFLKAIVETLFVCREFDENCEVFGDKISHDLLPRASALVIKSVGSIAQRPGEEAIELIQSAAGAHLRIPRVSRKFLSVFSKSAIMAWVDCQFRSAARVCSTEYLPPLLASSAFGACCDVIHTRCCTVMASIGQFIQYAVDRCDDLSLTPGDLIDDVSFEPQVVEYYKAVCVPCSMDEDEFELVVKYMKMNKFLHSRRTVERTLNAMADVFQQAESPTAGDHGIVGTSSHAILRLLGEWVGHDETRMEKAIKEGLIPVLDAPQRPTMTVSKRPTELDATEMIHSRKLVLPPSPGHGLATLDVGVFMVCAFYYKAKREEVRLSKETLGAYRDSPIVPEWIERLRHLRNFNSKGCE